MSHSREFADPEMDQRAGVTIHRLLAYGKSALFEEWRPSWMDGSDDDDGECRSEAYNGHWTSQEYIPIPAVLLI